jgi:SAM-dependent methyltransferase
MSNHLGGCVITGDDGTFAPQVWDKIIEIHSPKTVIDVGCGAGHSLKYFLDKHLDGIGVEGYKEAIEKSKVRESIVLHDYTLGPFIPPNDFDLAWCCEFVEHVEEKYVSNFMKTFQKCKLIAMTHGVPGQPGYHHVNCQEAKYWIDIFSQYDFSYLEEESLMLRKTLFNLDGSWTPNGSHVRNTLMIFKRNNQ